MGVNNKQRRAAMRKKKASSHRPPGPGPGAAFVSQPTPVSFRQSFLVAYAGRIRERLLAAADDAVHDTGRGAELVPVLHRQAEEVDAATQAIFPRLVTREAAISNAQGWVAGRAAADFARLDAGKQIAEAG